MRGLPTRLSVLFLFMGTVSACSGSMQLADKSELVVDASPDAKSTVDAGPSDASADSVPDAAPDAHGKDSSPTDSSSDLDTALDVTLDSVADVALDSPQDAGPYHLPVGRICPDSKYSSPIPAGNLNDPKLVESSGIVASRVNPEVLWLHNDSGDTAQLYATGKDGKSLGHLILDGIQAVDWEDLALAPCPDFSGPCLWIADTGNNTTPRDTFPIYVVPEPKFAQSLGEFHSKVFWTIQFKYPSGAVDSEAFMVAPDLSAFYLIEKIDAAKARVFAAVGPFANLSAPIVVKQIASLTSPGVPVTQGRMITAADLHPSGSRMLLRTYTGVYEYLLPSVGGVNAIGSILPKVVLLGPLSEKQGEALSYDTTGSGLWSVSEDTTANPGQPLHHYSCSVPDQPVP